MINMIKAVFFALFLIHSYSVAACTIISASNANTVLFGGNEDQPPNDSYLVIDKNGVFGVVFFATPIGDHPLIMQMGINEKGLSYDINALPPIKMTPHPEKLSKSETSSTAETQLWAIDKLIKESSSVDEVIKNFYRYNWGDEANGQIHFADGSGTSVVFYPNLDGEWKFFKKGRGDKYLITTNFNHARRIKESRSFSDRAFSLLLDSKYEIADNLLKQHQDNNLTVKYLASILNATHRDWILNTKYSFKTLFSVVYDLRNLKIFLYYKRNYESPIVFDVRKELLKAENYRKESLDSLIIDTTSNGSSS